MFFTDPIFSTTIWASSLMCLTAALMGVIAFLQKRSLIGETLSHATYPGVLIGGWIFSLFFADSFLGVILGSVSFSTAALFSLRYLEKKRVSQDASLCFVLSTFFALGVLIASRLQTVKASLYQQIQVYLFGQTATMRDEHVVIYAGLSLIIGAFLILFFPRIKLLLFDKEYARGKLKHTFWNSALSLLFIVSICIGIRTVGIVLMSGMLIAPAVFARAFTNRLSHLFLIAGTFGAMCGFLGNILSIVFSLPTGPVIALLGCVSAVGALIFSPKRGVLFRTVRILKFRLHTMEENLLKSIFKKEGASLAELNDFHPIHPYFLKLALTRLKRDRFLQSSRGIYSLTPEGNRKAVRIIRIHRLWEVYLTEFMGQSVEKVHRSAEEMEHIITPEIESRLTDLLSNPRKDPHGAPIPGRHDESILG